MTHGPESVSKWLKRPSSVTAKASRSCRLAASLADLASWQPARADREISVSAETAVSVPFEGMDDGQA